MVERRLSTRKKRPANGKNEKIVKISELRKAIIAGDVGLVKKLMIDDKIDVNFIFEENNYKRHKVIYWSFLHLVLGSKLSKDIVSELVLFLLEAGANINLIHVNKEDVSFTPLEVTLHYFK